MACVVRTLGLGLLPLSVLVLYTPCVFVRVWQPYGAKRLPHAYIVLGIRTLSWPLERLAPAKRFGLVYAVRLCACVATVWRQAVAKRIHLHAVSWSLERLAPAKRFGLVYAVRLRACLATVWRQAVAKRIHIHTRSWYLERLAPAKRFGIVYAVRLCARLATVWRQAVAKRIHIHSELVYRAACSR